jgi:hypothetical protein
VIQNRASPQTLTASFSRKSVLTRGLGVSVRSQELEVEVRGIPAVVTGIEKEAVKGWAIQVTKARPGPPT